MEGTPSMINLKESDEDSEKFGHSEAHDDIITAFEVFDLEKTGLIPKQKLKYVLTELGMGMNSDDADALIHSLRESMITKVRLSRNLNIQDKIEYIDYIKLFTDGDMNEKGYYQC